MNIISKNLVLIFFQEDYSKNKSLILETIKKLNEKDNDFNIKVLFTYGDNQEVEKQGMVFGNQAFIESINTVFCSNKQLLEKYLKQYYSKD